MKATHTDYKHPRHLRVEMMDDVYCMAPSHSQYSRLNRPGLPKFGANKADRELPRHSSEQAA